MLIWKDELLYLFGASENTISYAADYMGIYALGTIFVQITLGLNSFITAQGFAKVGMKTVIIGAVLNIVLRPGVHIRAGHGRKGRGTRDDHLASGILRVGHLVPLRQQNGSAA